MGRHSRPSRRGPQALAALIVTGAAIVVAPLLEGGSSATAGPTTASMPTSTSASTSASASASRSTATADPATPSGPCRSAVEEEQQGAPVEATTPEVEGAGIEAHGIVRVVPDGLCLTWTGRHTRGWKVTDVTTKARQTDARFTSSVARPSGERPLFVPLDGCVRMAWTVTVLGPDDETGTWTARGRHGRDCPPATAEAS